ncbi:Imm6 family immunity protein [Sphingomonas zeicaulis]|uniref:Imm6 family immunity protein n=1 Tax=Sphingomonas zeicaulis TaxID=1632740 RepID=UPI003D2359C1
MLALDGGEEGLKGLSDAGQIADARSALDLARRMLASEAPAYAAEDTLQNEQDEGILIREQETGDETEKAAWLSVASALAYAARVGYQREGELPSPLVSEVRDDEVAVLEKYLLQIPNVDWPQLLGEG